MPYFSLKFIKPTWEKYYRVECFISFKHNKNVKRQHRKQPSTIPSRTSITDKNGEYLNNYFSELRINF